MGKLPNKEGTKRGIAALRGSHLSPGVRASSDKSKFLNIQISCSSAFDSEGYQQIRTAVAANKQEEDGEVTLEQKAETQVRAPPSILNFVRHRKGQSQPPALQLSEEEQIQARIRERAGVVSPLQLRMIREQIYHDN